MKTPRNSCALALAAMLALAGPAAARSPLHDLAGIRVGMSEHEARERLERAGATTGGESEERDEDAHQSWQMKRGPWGYVVIGFADERVDWVTAFLRPDASPLHFDQVGPVAASQRPGNFLSVWQVPARGSAPAFSVIARGRDSLNVASVSLKQVATSPLGPSADRR